MAKFTVVDERVESKSERKVRFFLAVMLFIQVVCTAIPFVWGPVEVDGEYYYATITAFNFLVNPGNYQNTGAIPLAVVGGILVILPMVAFFFCVLDSKSRVKFIVSGLCSFICAAVIVFTFGKMVYIGAVITLVLNVICLFMSSQGFMATTIRMREQKK